MPLPIGLVVKKGFITSIRISFGIPGPLSLILIETLLFDSDIVMSNKEHAVDVAHAMNFVIAVNVLKS